MSGWTQDLARAMNADDLKKLNKGVLDTMDAVANAHTALNGFEEDLNDLQARKAQVTQEFGPPFFFGGFIPMPNWPALVAISPLLTAEANLKVGGRRLAAIDVLFSELALTYEGMGNPFARAGLDAEARGVRTAARLMREWRAALQARAIPRMPSILDDREAIEANFNAALAARGLRRILDDEKPGYFDALSEVLKQYTETPEPEEAEAAKPAGMQGARMGVEPVSMAVVISSIIQAVIIIAGIITIVALITSAVKSVYGAGDKAMEAARELQHRKTVREEEVQRKVESNEAAVQAGTMDRAEADERNKDARAEADQSNKADGEQFREEAESAAAAAARATPDLGRIFLWGGLGLLGLGAGYVGLKMARVL